MSDRGGFYFGVGERFFGQRRPGHRSRRMRGGDNDRVFVSQQCGLGVGVAR